MYDGNVIRFGNITPSGIVSDFPDQTGARIRIPPNVQNLGYNLKTSIANKFIKVREYCARKGYGDEVLVGTITFIVGLVGGAAAGGFVGHRIGSGAMLFKGLKMAKKAFM